MNQSEGRTVDPIGVDTEGGGQESDERSFAGAKRAIQGEMDARNQMGGDPDGQLTGLIEGMAEMLGLVFHSANRCL